MENKTMTKLDNLDSDVTALALQVQRQKEEIQMLTDVSTTQGALLLDLLLRMNEIKKQAQAAAPICHI
jgi:hypothetical protein